MYLRSFFSLQLFITSSVASIYMIRDYFLFKNASRITGFCCGDCENDFVNIKVFNEVGKLASIIQLGPNIDVSRFLQTKYWSLGVFLDLRCLETENYVTRIFQEASQDYMFGHLHQWLILTNNMTQAIRVLNDSAFSITTDLVISVSRNHNYILYDVYNHCKPCGGVLNITELGTWSKADGINITLAENKFSRRCNYYGMKVKVAGIIVAKPLRQNLADYLQEWNNVLDDNWSKFGYSMMIHIAEMFNFTYEVTELNYSKENDAIDPLITDLGGGIFDLVYTPSILTDDRLNYASIITQVWPARTCFMFRTVSSINMNTIFRPFDKNVWYILLVFSIIMTFVLWMILKLVDISGSDCGTIILIIIAALCQQGLPFDCSQSASRIALLQTLLYGLLVYNYYSAAIVSSRLNAPLNKMNDSLYSLAKSGLNLAANKDVYFNSILHTQTAEVQYFRRYWKDISAEKKYLAKEEGIKRIMVSGFAYHVDPIIAYPIIERTFSEQVICELTEVHLLRPTSLGLWSKRHSYFREITKIGLIKMYTAGIRKRQLDRWTSRKPYCNENTFFASSVTFYEVIPIIFIFIIAAILSVIIYSLECIVYRTFQSKKVIQYRSHPKLIKKCKIAKGNKISLLHPRRYFFK